MMSRILAAFSICLWLLHAPVSAEEGYGTLQGQFVLAGKVPEPKLVVAARVPRPGRNFCSKKPIYDQSLLIDSKSKGIANVLVYVRKVEEIHPQLRVTPEKQRRVEFVAKGCQFVPHVLKVRTDQTVLLKSADPIPHNTHPHPFINDEVNLVVRPGDRKGVPLQYPKPEPLPVKVTCDLHPHMRAFWLVLDHPYSAVTDKAGKFKIDQLPVGEYDFIVWHERVGYLDKKHGPIQNALQVRIESEIVEDVGKVEVPLRLLTE